MDKINYSALHASAAVSEVNGEVSCSVEETNKLRSALGLRPLNIGTSGSEPTAEEIAVRNWSAARQHDQSEKRLAEIEEQLARARRKRELRSHNSVGERPGLADTNPREANDTATLSAADWVRKSRSTAQLLAEKRALMLDEMDTKDAYASRDLKGLTVTHDADHFVEGEEVVLTLKDQSVLDTDEHGKVLGLAEGGDELENVNMADDKRTAKRLKTAARARRPVYSGIDDDEFTDGVAMGPGAKRAILTHYDDVREQRDEFVLTEGGGARAETKALDGGEDDGDEAQLPQSLQVNKTDVVEYYTNEEMGSFRKPKKMRKKKKLRKHQLDGDDDVAESSFAASTEGSDHGSRVQGGNAAKSREAAMAFERAERRAAFDSAAAKAANRTAQAFSAPINAPPDVPGALEIEGDDDDAELGVSLARARRIAQLREQQQTRVDAAEQVAEQIGRGASSGPAVGSTVTDASDTGLVFTSTTEFSHQLKARLQDRAREKAHAAASTTAEQDAVKHSEPIEAPVHPHPVTTNADMRSTESVVAKVTETTEDCEDDDDQMEFMHKQPLARTGMAATLALLQTTGDLKLEHQEEKIGRARDMRHAPDDDEDDEDGGVKLEYRDKNGRLLTRKEAFRQMSYKFHGHGPGAKKVNKRLAQIAEAERTTGNQLKGGSMALLQRAQAATGNAGLPMMAAGQALASTIAPGATQDAHSKRKAEKKAKKARD